MEFGIGEAGLVAVAMLILLAGCAGPTEPGEDRSSEDGAPGEEQEPVLGEPVPTMPSHGAEQVGSALQDTAVDVSFHWQAATYSGSGPVSYAVLAGEGTQPLSEVCRTTEETSCSARFPVGSAVRWLVEAEALDVEDASRSEPSNFMTQRPVLLLHGWTSKGEKWDEWIPLLREQGFFVLDGNASRPGTQAPTYETSLLQNLHIPRIASEHVQPTIRKAFNASGLDSSTNFDIVAHSMGGLVARVLAEHPGASTTWGAFNGTQSDDPSTRVAPDWAQRIKTLVMVGTPNHGATDSVLKDVICASFNEQCRDMTRHSPFLQAMGYEGSTDIHYVSIGTIEPSPSRFLDLDGDGIKHGGDCLVPAESPYLSNPGHFYLLSGLYHSEPPACGTPDQKASPEIAKIVLSELENKQPPTDLPPVPEAEPLPDPTWQVNHEPTAFRAEPTQGQTRRRARPTGHARGRMRERGQGSGLHPVVVRLTLGGSGAGGDRPRPDPRQPVDQGAHLHARETRPIGGPVPLHRSKRRRRYDGVDGRDRREDQRPAHGDGSISRFPGYGASRRFADLRRGLQQPRARPRPRTVGESSQRRPVEPGQGRPRPDPRRSVGEERTPLL